MSFGIGENVRSEVRVCTPDLFHGALDHPEVGRTCAEIEDALEACRRGEMAKEEYETRKAGLKKRLPIFTFHATFRNGRRKNEDAVPSGLCIYDLDHIPNPQAKWAEMEARKAELGIVMAHITPSAEGLRLVFIVPKGMTLAQAQGWMAERLGDKQYDTCVKDFARCSFAVPRGYVLYLDEARLFGERPEPEAEEETPCPESPESPACGEPMPVPTFGEKFQGIAYEDIVSVLEEQMGGRPEHGSRNNFIFSMACHLRYICDDDPEWIAQVLPTYGEAREKWMATIRSACARNQTRAMPRIMKRTLDICKERTDGPGKSEESLPEPPKMPRILPRLIRLLVSKTPDIYRPAVAHAVFPALGAHLWQTTFRYIDNVAHEATLMNVLMAGTGAGKNCICEPINRIMADIRRRDAENLRLEREWKREMQTRGANKDKRQRPEGLVIQEIDPDMTNAAFVQRLADAEGRFLYARMNEIDQFDALKTSQRSKTQFQIMCLAFDPGNVYGQTRVGTSSVSERVCIRFNWNACTTIQKGVRYFHQVLTDGPISRINFCTIPERPIGSEMPVYGTYDTEFDAQLRPFIEHLTTARGEIDCPQARTLARRLMEECADFSRLSQNRVYENLSFRANVIAFLKACILYVANGCQWDKSIERFVRWSLRYDLWCKMQFFGHAISEQENSAGQKKKPGVQSLLNLLPDIFTREDADLLRARLGIRTGNTRYMLSNWKKRGYIELYGEELPQSEIAAQRYTKTPAYVGMEL